MSPPQLDESLQLRVEREGCVVGDGQVEAVHLLCHCFRCRLPQSNDARASDVEDSRSLLQFARTGGKLCDSLTHPALMEAPSIRPSKLVHGPKDWVIMQLTFLGKETQGGGSPTLFATDQDTYVVQGWKVSGQPASVEIPARLLTYLQPGTRLGVALRDTAHDTFVVSGVPVTDHEALSQMDIPGHETCVEVPKAQEGEARGATSG
ncbi:MAG: hypothetical protein ACJ72N_07760 [Labedaea sp.]